MFVYTIGDIFGLVMFTVFVAAFLTWGICAGIAKLGDAVKKYFKGVKNV